MYFWGLLPKGMTVEDEICPKVRLMYMDGTITKKEFLEWYKNPDNYRPELPSTNRGHKYE